MLNKIADSIMGNDPEATAQIVKEALNADISAKDILQGGLIVGMNIMGQKFKAGDVFVPEVLIAAMCMQSGLDILKPLLQNEKVESQGKIVFGTVAGDIHDIGKNLCVIMLEGAGFEVIDLGTDVSAEKFEEAIIKHNPDIVACSALLTTTMTEMPTIINHLEEKGLRHKVKVILGGAPITEKWAIEAGADGYSDDAASAVELAKELLKVS